MKTCSSVAVEPPIFALIHAKHQVVELFLKLVALLPIHVNDLGYIQLRQLQVLLFRDYTVDCVLFGSFLHLHSHPRNVLNINNKEKFVNYYYF